MGVNAVKSAIKLGGILNIKNSQFVVRIDIIVKTIIDVTKTIMPIFTREGFNGAVLDMLMVKIIPMIPQLAKCVNKRIPKTLAVLNAIPKLINVKKTYSTPNVTYHE